MKKSWKAMHIPAVDWVVEKAAGIKVVMTLSTLVHGRRKYDKKGGAIQPLMLEVQSDPPGQG